MLQHVEKYVVLWVHGNYRQCQGIYHGTPVLLRCRPLHEYYILFAPAQTGLLLVVGCAYDS